MSIILGISAYYHDSAAAIIRDGVIIAAAQEERFTRIKHDSAFPRRAIEYCLNELNAEINAVDKVVFFEKPFLKFERLIETYLAMSPKGVKSFVKAMPVWIKEKLFQKSNLIAELQNFDSSVNWSSRILFSEHHLSHAASAFFPSPFKEAAILTMDGVGEWATSTIAVGQLNQIRVLQEMHFPHSLGLLYSAFTYHLGFKVNSGEYKLMGLAPYGEPRYKEKILQHLLTLKEDGSFRINLNYFDYCTGLKMTNKKFAELFEIQPKLPEQPFSQAHLDLAASIQAVTEEIVLRTAIHVKKITGLENLCLAGGVALNCVANGALERAKMFNNIWVQPASGDAGGSLGAALLIHFQYFHQPRNVSSDHQDAMRGAYLGPQFDDQQVENQLYEIGAKFENCDWDVILERVSQDLIDGKAVGWFQGRMEFGPRALGNRSILADARNPGAQKNLNLKVKYRESFRPFAPAVLEEKVSEWFEFQNVSPYMLMVANVRKDKRTPKSQARPSAILEHLNQIRSEIPAVTHIDYSARLQTISKKTNPHFHQLVSHFENKTRCPVLVNTSFNVRGEPIVCTPQEAFRCFMGTEIETLVVGKCYLTKDQQNPNLKNDYKDHFELD